LIRFHQTSEIIDSRAKFRKKLDVAFFTVSKTIKGLLDLKTKGSGGKIDSAGEIM